MADLNSYINIGANSVEAVTVSATGDITTSQNIGATGDLNVGGNIDVDGNTAIGGNLFVTGNINFTGNVTQISGNSGVFFGDPATGVGALYAGKTGYTPLPSTILQVTGDENAYIQTNFQNTNHGNTASMEVAITADDGTDITNYIDLGIAGSTWDGTQDNSLGTAVARRDGYLYVQGGSAGGNLVLGTTTAGYAVKFNAGGPGSANTVAQISNTGISTSGTVSASGNITANYLFGNGSQLTGLPATYSDSNVTTLLAAYGSNTVSTTGNITSGNLKTNNNLIFTANTSNIVFNNTAYINGSGNAVGRDGSIMLVPYTGAGSTFPGVVIGGAGRLIAPNGSVHQILNASDVTFQVPIKTTSTAATSTTTGAVQVAGGVGVVGNIYAGGLASVTGNVAGSNILTAGVVSATGNVTAGNISTAGLISAGGNVTAQNFIGNISITGNVTGTSSNVSLVAGSYTWTFDNTSILTLPAPSGSNEGAEIDFGKAGNSTLSGNTVVFDQYVDRFRFFESGGTNRGAYIDLTQAATSVGTLLNNRVSSAGLALNTSLSFDNLAIQIKAQSSGVWIFAGTVTSTATYQYSITYQLSGSAANGTIGTMSATTTQATIGSSAWFFNSAASSSTVILTDTTNSKMYRVTWQTTSGSSPYGNYVSIERLV